MISFLSPKNKNRISEIKIHSAATSAFEFIKKQQPLFSSGIRKNLFNIKSLRGDAIFRGIIIETELHIFSGFESTIFNLDSLELKDATILIHKNITNDEVEILAWKAVLSNSLLNSISSENLDLIHTNINEKIPKSISKRLYFKPHLSVTLLAQMAGKTKNTIAKQKARHNASQAENHISIFEQLINEDSNNELSPFKI
ncbi:hypothetical protein J8L86_20120 [Shewanella sp. MMG014]|uniref:hypothetical protein n=1 Tax=Shewanella sp. MMG014 TaxID=2822691 RepID=UPI001B35A409|nr:hypothetical protein [Shewanella sp. MMG014]MBQ4892163.1 hypothetical protein [Shewanella sp. MMG014]